MSIRFGPNLLCPRAKCPCFKMHHDYNKARTRIYWRCWQRKICNASITTNNNLDDFQIFRDGTAKHLHAADPAEIEVKRISNRVKRRALESPNETPSAGLAATVGAPPEEIVQRLPERRSMRRMVNRVQVGQRPQNPKTIQDLLIAPPQDVTLRGTRFPMYDSSVDDPDRLLIFASPESLKILAICDMLFSDRTFKTVPQAFAQLFSIHGRFMGFVFPLVFALTTRLTEDTYSRVYEQVKIKCTELGVTVGRAGIDAGISFMMDFELANMNAVKAVFPAVHVKGYMFHFDQMIYRKVVELGLKTDYETVRSDIRQDVVALMAVPFIPLDDLVDTFTEVTEEMDERLDDIVTHLDVHYVRGVLRRRRRVAPRFAPAIWNTNQAALDGDHRTNNAVKAWHNHLQHMMVIRHASMWRFLENLKKEENEIHTQARGGHTKIKEPVNKKYQTNQRQVEQIVRNYQLYKDGGDIPTYLRAIGYHLKAGAPPTVQEPDDPDSD
ncbi:Alanine--tRNA ligase [Frankliniella fusca]|uniref:Alanine--tRNA ligase n=1 Tax=Frankliniella fusca TaxID=407009 RepID=A0AAE1GQZ0_9NEOP|nr:Alanine--tRNA ligase [Frankliniella fusca]